MKDRMTTCLWFNGNAEAAANFYAETFPNSSVGAIRRAPADNPSTKAGDVLVVEFTLMGQDFIGLNGGAAFTHSEAVSFQVFTEDQAETDRLWATLTANGGEESMCSWCKDRFGLSWQIVPRRLVEIMNSDDHAAAARGMQAMMTMKKIDIAALDRAFAGEDA